MIFFSPIWKTKDRSKVGEAKEYIEKIEDPAKLLKIVKKAPREEVYLAAWEKLRDVDLYEQIAMDESYRDRIRLFSVRKLSEIQKGFDRQKYTDFLSRFLDLAVVNDEFEIAVSLTGDYDRLLKLYKEITAHEIMMKSCRKKIEPLKKRISRGPAIQSAPIQDDRSRCEYVIKYATKENPYIDIVRQINDKEMLKTIACHDSIPIKTRLEAAAKAGLHTPFGKRSYVCKSCGKPVVYHQSYENSADGGWQTVREFSCLGNCWKSLGQIDNSKVNPGDVSGEFDDLINDIIFICPLCYGVSGYTTTAPSMKECTCMVKPKPVPVKAFFDTY